MDKKVLLLGCGEQATQLRRGGGRVFVPEVVGSLEEALARRAGAAAAVVGQAVAEAETACRVLIENNLPVLLFTSRSGQQLEDLLAGMDVGCADVLDDSMSVAEWWRRIELVVMHRVANDQLQTQLRLARAVASTAMRTSSDMSVSLRFMVEANHCESLDELGLRLFQVLDHFGLDCSLQIRSAGGVKNMDGNGMPRELESHLLHELREAGQHIDFGRRTIVNYGLVSLLVRNMPVDNPDRYGQLKEALFSLLQGVDGRARALEALLSLHEEQSARQLLDQITRHVRSVVFQVEEASHEAVKHCADLVEELALAIERELSRSHLGHKEEERLLTLLETAVTQVNQQFVDRLRLDDQVNHLLAQLELPLTALAQLPSLQTRSMTTSSL